VTAPTGVFRAVQLDVAWPLGPPDGRYLMRAQDGAPTHVVVVQTLERPAVPRRLRGAHGDAGGWLTRVTVIDSGASLEPGAAVTWLAAAGERELEDGIAALNQMLQAHRLAAADPLAGTFDRRQAQSSRLGYGSGDELASGRLSAARELPWQAPDRPRRRMLSPEGRLAALLTGRDRPLMAEELALRARLDLDFSLRRTATLQILIALDASIAELAGDERLADRLASLRADREPVAAAAQAALAGEPSAEQLAAVTEALQRIEAALRARTLGRD
jgi:hypothetical protein